MSDDLNAIDGIVGRFIQAQHQFVGEMKAALAVKDAEIERLMAEHDDYVIRANANVCEFNREIERLRNEMGDELLLEETKLMRAALRKQSAEIEQLRALLRDRPRDDGTVLAVGGEPGASAGKSE